jgi:hypothetical protein
MKVIILILLLPVMAFAQTPTPSVRPSIDDLISKLPAEQRSVIVFPGLYVDQTKTPHRAASAALVESMLKAGYSEEDCKAWLASYEKRIAAVAGGSTTELQDAKKPMTLEEELAQKEERRRQSPIRRGESSDEYRLRLRYEDLIMAGQENSKEAVIIANQLEAYAVQRDRRSQEWRDYQMWQQTELLRQIRANQ